MEAHVGAGILKLSGHAAGQLHDHLQMGHGEQRLVRDVVVQFGGRELEAALDVLLNDRDRLLVDLSRPGQLDRLRPGESEESEDFAGRLLAATKQTSARVIDRPVDGVTLVGCCSRERGSSSLHFAHLSTFSLACNTD